MTKYREIIRLAQPSLRLSQEKIASGCGVSKKTVNKVLAAARDKNLTWPLPASYTDAVIEGILFPPGDVGNVSPSKRMPDFEYIHKELLRNGVNKKLLCDYFTPGDPDRNRVPIH